MALLVFHSYPVPYPQQFLSCLLYALDISITFYSYKNFHYSKQPEYHFTKALGLLTVKKKKITFVHILLSSSESNSLNEPIILCLNAYFIFSAYVFIHLYCLKILK